MLAISLNVEIITELVKKTNKRNRKYNKWKLRYKAKRNNFKIKTKILIN
jgi:hypothetical protein